MNVFFAIHGSDMFIKSIHELTLETLASFCQHAIHIIIFLEKTLGLFNEMTKFGATRPPLLNITKTF